MKKFFLWGGLFLLVLGLAACNLPASTPATPTCPTAGLLPPVLVAPHNEGVAASLSPSLIWAYPDSSCNPEGYRIDLSVDADFADTRLSGGAGGSATTWAPATELQNCQVYYWRVAAINGTTLGPFSEAQTFQVNVDGSCAPPAPPPSASISGVVWHDLCAPPAESGALPPAGCVALPGGGFAANGIREPGEPGIEGVEVNLHFGACTDPVVASLRTGPGGEYNFDGILAFGPHCVSVDALSSVNEPILIPGGWTAPAGTTTPLAQAVVSLASGDNLSSDFGWDYQFLPAVSAPAAPTATPESEVFSVNTGANCRRGPGTVYDVVTAFPEGTRLKVVGRSNDGSWWLVQIPNNTERCWISNVTGTFTGNPSVPAVVAAPPTPTPVPDTTPPSLSGAAASVLTLYYASNACGPTAVEITVKATDPSGIKDVVLRYRYVGPAYFGVWRTASAASVVGDEFKFSLNVANEAISDMQALNGTFEYQFIATDKANNSVTSPATPLSITLNYCQ